MAKYALKRLILILPTLVAVLSILFILTKLLPGDPVLFSMGESERVYENSQTLSNQRYNIVAKRMGLDKPLFYFSIVPSDLPKDYYSLPPAERQYAQSLIDKYKSAALVTSLVNHYMELNQTESQVTEIDFLNFLNSFPMDLELVKQEVDVYMEEYPTHDAVIRMDELLKGILTSETPHLSYLPKVVWHGMNNQFHQWIFDALTFNIGASRINGKSAWSMIIDAIPRTLVINLLSIIIAYLLSILIGVYAGWWEGSFDTILS
ncbi:MAG: hypothetical protein HKN76_18265, partial [Saprospiraceae bacterium]|nr:hypothetical protein [Saprospiraceae bacterium]